MPPRHGKSEVVSRRFPAWYLGHHPDRNVILTTYGAELASDLSRVARATLREWGEEIFQIRIAQDSAAVGRWGIEGHEGGLFAVGVGGPITGRGGDLIVIDDPFKNAEEAASATTRENVWQWYLSTLYTRQAPGAAIVLVQTRWHRDDLAGRLLAEAAAGGEQWEVIDLPAIAEEGGDALGRAPGTPLWPERFDAAALADVRRTLGSYWWNCLYQQHPGDPEGNLFKRERFRYFERRDDLFVLHAAEGDRAVPAGQCLVFQTCDPAGSTRTTADYFVLSTWAMTPTKDLLLLDVIRTRIEGPDQPALIRAAYDRWRPAVQGVERAGIGLPLLQTLQRSGLPILPLVPERDKVTRALSVAARYEAGTVYHLAHAPWIGEWEEELVGFPNAPHDDQVDTASYAADLLVQIDGLLHAPTGVGTLLDEEDRVTISPV